MNMLLIILLHGFGDGWIKLVEVYSEHASNNITSRGFGDGWLELVEVHSEHASNNITSQGFGDGWIELVEVYMLLINPAMYPPPSVVHRYHFSTPH